MSDDDDDGGDEDADVDEDESERTSMHACMRCDIQVFRSHVKETTK